jgi:hypothetical protein
MKGLYRSRHVYAQPIRPRAKKRTRTSNTRWLFHGLAIAALPLSYLHQILPYRPACRRPHYPTTQAASRTSVAQGRWPLPPVDNTSMANLYAVGTGGLAPPFPPFHGWRPACAVKLFKRRPRKPWESRRIPGSYANYCIRRSGSLGRHADREERSFCRNSNDLALVRRPLVGEPLARPNCITNGRDFPRKPRVIHDVNPVVVGLFPRLAVCVWEANVTHAFDTHFYHGRFNDLEILPDYRPKCDKHGNDHQSYRNFLQYSSSSSVDPRRGGRI